VKGLRRFTLLTTGIILIVSACNAPAVSSPQSSENTPTPAPYSPDTPSPPTVDAPVVGTPSLVFIQFINSLDGWGVTETQIVRTTDGGITWYNITPQGVTETGYNVALVALDSNNAWMHQPDFDNYPNSGTLYHTVDGGLSWMSTPSPFSQPELYFLDANNGWVLASLDVAVGSNAVAVYQTTDGGTTWIQKYINYPNATNAGESLPLGGLKAGISPINMQTAFVYGVTYAYGTPYLFRTDDGGTVWTQVSLPLPVGVGDFELSIDQDQMKFVSSTNGFIVMRLTGDNSQLAVYVTQDGGDTWILTATPIPEGGSADFLSAEEIAV